MVRNFIGYRLKLVILTTFTLNLLKQAIKTALILVQRVVTLSQLAQMQQLQVIVVLQSVIKQAQQAIKALLLLVIMYLPLITMQPQLVVILSQMEPTLLL